MYNQLPGKVWAYKAGVNGTVTLPEGAKVLQIIVHCNPAATMTIFGGDTIPLPANDVQTFRFLHGMAAAPSADKDIVFSANVTSYFIEYATP